MRCVKGGGMRVGCVKGGGMRVGPVKGGGMRVGPVKGGCTRVGHVKGGGMDTRHNLGMGTNLLCFTTDVVKYVLCCHLSQAIDVAFDATEALGGVRSQRLVIGWCFFFFCSPFLEHPFKSTQFVVSVVHDHRHMLSTCCVPYTGA